MNQGLVRQNTGLSGLPLGLLPYLLSGGFFIAAVGGGYLLLRKLILAIKKGRLLNDVGANSQDGLAIGYAGRFYAAMVRGNTQWWNDVFGDGTDEDALFAVAADMSRTRVPFALVANKYQTLYDRFLLNDLTSELPSDDLQRFNRILQTGLGATPVHQGVVIEHDLVTTKATVTYTDALVPVQQVPGNVWLGAHLETIITPGLGSFHGFSHNGAIRFVPAPAVAFRNARA